MQDLNEKQKERFAKFLTEFQDVFSEEIIAGNYTEHIIKIEDSNETSSSSHTFSITEESR